MAWVGAVAAGGATAYNLHQESQYLKDKAAALRDAGHRQIAAGTRDFGEAEREREYMYSRALAVAAASGGGVDTPGMVKVLSDLQAEGKYRSFAKLWQAQDDASGLYAEAESAQKQREAVQSMRLFNTVVSAISGYYTAGGSFGLTGKKKSAKATLPDPFDLKANRQRLGGTGKLGISSDGLPYSPSAGSKLWEG